MLFSPSKSAHDTFEDRFSPAKVRPGQFAEDADVILFVHIPKTAGMSVGKSLQNAFDMFHPVSWENTRQSFRQKTRQALYMRQNNEPARQILMGHFNCNDIAYWQSHGIPVKCATIIRDPLDRLVSNYLYNTSDRHPQCDAFTQKFPDLESYAAKLPFDYQLFTMIGPTWNFEHALERLEQTYSFIGVTEHLAASLSHFAVSHGLDGLQEHRENIGTKAPPEVSDAVRNMVAEKSGGDQALHDLVKGYFAQ